MCVCVFCVAVMRFMGDAPLRGQSEQEVVSTFLKVNTHIIILQSFFFESVLISLHVCVSSQLIGEFTLMRDEAYCQLLKQLTANTSSKP